MAKIVDYRDIPLADLIIGKSQVRTGDLGAGMDELARSIEVQGLLQPIVVCPASEQGKWEILTGQRRFLAHKQLKRDTIAAAVIDEPVEPGHAKAISITENLIRRRLSGRERKDGITYLYQKYGSIKDVVEATGLPYNDVRGNVMYPRLLNEMKTLVDDEGVDVNVALKAQDAMTDAEGNVAIPGAVKLAREMNSMTGPQRKKTINDLKSSPGASIDDMIESGKTGGKVTQIVATVTEDTRIALQRFAKEGHRNQDEAAVALIEESLIRRGLLNEED